MILLPDTAVYGWGATDIRLSVKHNRSTWMRGILIICIHVMYKSDSRFYVSTGRICIALDVIELIQALIISNNSSYILVASCRSRECVADDRVAIPCLSYLCNTPVDKNSREYLLRQVANGRYSLLLIVILTVVNLIMTILDTNTYFLFSASVPYYLVFVGMGIENGFVDGAWNVKGTLTYTGLVIALVIVAVYLLCWLLSKERAGWLTAALVLFIIDTVALVVITFALYDSPMGKLVDFLLHIWAIVELVQGVRGSKKLKALPPAEEPRNVYTGPEL